MKTHTFPRLQEQYYEQVLPNGLTVRVLPKPRFDKFYAVLAVKYGSIDMDFRFRGNTYHTPAGVAHYLEHKMFDLPEGNAMDGFHAYGGSPNAYTSYDMTAYYVQAVEQTEENLRHLLHMVFTPYFTEQSVQKERGIIAEEIKMYTDNPESQVYERMFAAMFPTQPLGIPIAGTVESIQKITAETLQLCYDAFYQPSNMILCVEGSLDVQTVLRIAQEQSPQAAKTPAERLAAEDPFAPAPLSPLRCEMDIAMPTFNTAVRLPNLAHADVKTEIAADLALELCAGEASECYRRLYERGLIDSGFFLGFEGVRNRALLSFGGDSRDPLAVTDAVFAAAKELAAAGIDPQALARMKKSALGRKMRDLDSFTGTCNRICGYYFDGAEYLDFPQIYDEIDAADILRILSLMVRENAFISVIDPKQTEEEPS